MSAHHSLCQLRYLLYVALALVAPSAHTLTAPARPRLQTPATETVEALHYAWGGGMGPLPCCPLDVRITSREFESNFVLYKCTCHVYRCFV